MDPKSPTKCRSSEIDSGYAWVVVVACMLSQLLIYGIVFSSGIFYDIFLEELGGSSAAVSLIASVNTALTYGLSKTLLQCIYDLWNVNVKVWVVNKAVVYMIVLYNLKAIAAIIKNTNVSSRS